MTLTSFKASKGQVEGFLLRCEIACIKGSGKTMKRVPALKLTNRVVTNNEVTTSIIADWFYQIAKKCKTVFNLEIA